MVSRSLNAADRVLKSTRNYGSIENRSPASDSEEGRPSVPKKMSTESLPEVAAERGSAGSGEVLLAGTRQCPTCRGTGRIHRDQENKLVALIPVWDNRLKPRRTTLYVGIAIFLCLIIGGLLMFFLLPRSVRIWSQVKTLEPLSAYVNRTQEIVFLQIRNEYNISNNNFFPVLVTKLAVRVLFDEKVVVDVTNTTALEVPLRSSRLYSIDFNITFDGDEGYMAYYCSGRSLTGHSIIMPFQATASTSYYGHTEDATSNFLQRVRCSKGS